jgi:hypothetical protein
METMEQHVFRTYETKYGLRSIAVEHAGALVRSLLVHAAADNEVMVFLKIFRNELEEDFRFIQSELFNSIKDLTMVQLMSRYPNKDTAAMNALLEQKMNGTIYEDEWTDMTSYLYNSADSTTLCVLLRKLAGAEKAKSGYFDTPNGATKVPLTVNSNAKIVKPNTAYVLESAVGNSGAPIGYDKRNVRDVKRLGYSSPTLQITVKENYADARKNAPKLPFRMFLRTVLDFQLQSHLQYLQSFVRVFREVDRDVDGVISAADFKECFLMIRRGSGDEAGDAGSVGRGKGGKKGKDTVFCNCFRTVACFPFWPSLNCDMNPFGCCYRGRAHGDGGERGDRRGHGAVPAADRGVRPHADGPGHFQRGGHLPQQDEAAVSGAL